MQFTRIILLIAAVSGSMTAYAKPTSCPIVTENGKTYYLYKVQKSEGFYSIGKQFDVSYDDIIQANPEAAEGLKLGQTLKIPTVRGAERPAKEVKVSPVAPGKTISHTVMPKETWYGISHRYGLTVTQLQAANPGKDALRIGDVLLIPPPPDAAVSSTTAPATVAVATSPMYTENTAKAPQPSTLVDEKYQEAGRQAFRTPDTISLAEQEEAVFDAEIPLQAAPAVAHNPTQHIRIAVLMPFSLNEPTENRNPKDNCFLDFYKGCLLAADSLSALGMQVEMDAYDIGKTTNSLQQALNNSKLQQVDILIGPAYSSQIRYVSEFARQHHIPTVVPFTSQISELTSNPWLFQVVCPQKELYRTVLRQYVQLWKNEHTELVFVQADSSGTMFNKKSFADELLIRAQQAGISCRQIAWDDLQRFLEEYSRPEGLYGVLIVPTDNKVKLIELSNVLENYARQQLCLFAFPEWHNLRMQDLYKQPVYTFANYRTNFQNPATAAFFRKFYQKYGQPDKQNVPSYALLGFDVCQYFGEQWRNNGEKFMQYLPAGDVSMLQMDFCFEKTSGGYINHGVILQRYDSEGLKTIDHRKETAVNP